MSTKTTIKCMSQKGCLDKMFLEKVNVVYFTWFILACWYFVNKNDKKYVLGYSCLVSNAWSDEKSRRPFSMNSSDA